MASYTISDTFQANKHFSTMNAFQQKQCLLEYPHTNTRKHQDMEIKTMFFLQGKELTFKCGSRLLHGLACQSKILQYKVVSTSLECIIQQLESF